MNNIENHIESQHRYLFENRDPDDEYMFLYKNIKNIQLREILSTLHKNFIELFKVMNERLPTNEHEAHFRAEPSRQLIKSIEIALDLYETLKDESEYAFDIAPYYLGLMKKCKVFLLQSGGSEIPPHMKKVELYYTIPIFEARSSITLKSNKRRVTVPLELIGEGSYAKVFKYKDPFYDKYFVIKRANGYLSQKELNRFKIEFYEMKNFSSPYILEVYNYDETKNEYIAEYMDDTLYDYIRSNNNTLGINERKNMSFQILKAFEYIHSKGRLHRDISPKNILVKKYDKIIVAKISDFGLVKVPDSSLTTINTEFKGSFNDPALQSEGFETYNMGHEIYALTRVICYVMTGKENIESIKKTPYEKFLRKGTNIDKDLRYKSVYEMRDTIRSLPQNS